MGRSVVFTFVLGTVALFVVMVNYSSYLKAQKDAERVRNLLEQNDYLGRTLQEKQSEILALRSRVSALEPVQDQVNILKEHIRKLEEEGMATIHVLYMINNSCTDKVIQDSKAGAIRS